MLDLVLIFILVLVLVPPFLLSLLWLRDDEYGGGDLNIDLSPDVAEVAVGLGLPLLALGQALTEQRGAIGSLKLFKIFKSSFFI